MAIESLDPEQALTLYLEKSSVAPERRQALLQAAREIMNAQQIGEGVAMDEAIQAEIRLAMPDDMEDAFALRRAIFIGEQNVDPEEEWDGRDDAAVHVVALINGEIVGTGRLLIDEGETTCRIGRMAVRQNLRRHGIGDGILAQLSGRLKTADLAKLSSTPRPMCRSSTPKPDMSSRGNASWKQASSTSP